MADWSASVGFRHLPSTGVHAQIDEVYPVDAPPIQSLACTWTDISVEDVVAAMVIVDIHAGVADTPPEVVDGEYFSLAVFTGRVPRWSVWVSRDAALLIRRFFETPVLRRDLLGASVLGAFESRDVQEARDTEATAVTAIWREGGEVEA
jgi:hypothetical protein